MKYEIAFAAQVKEHLKALTARERTSVFDAIEKQLVDQPLDESRNRKPLRPNPIAPWELRIGTLRVFYEVAESDSGTVRVLAIGKKERNQLRIAGQEYEL